MVKDSFATIDFTATGCKYTQDDEFLDALELDRQRGELTQIVEESNVFKVLHHWAGTILNEVIYDAVFWMTLILYAALRVWERLSNRNNDDGEATYHPETEVLDSLPIVGGFLTLFLVFFVNQNHARYYDFHGDTMFIMGRICDLSALTVSSLPIERARRINRYCNAAHVIMYAGLSEHLRDGKVVQNLCRDYALLTPGETSRMETLGFTNGKAGACFELLTWAMMDVNRALKAGLIDSMLAHEMRDQIVTFRSKIAKIFVTTLCPIPFFYVHFLSLLTAIYLPLFALMVSFKTGSVDIPWYAEIVGVALVLLQNLFVVGLRMLGQQLGNPYGDDFIDIQTTTYIIMVLSTSNRILESIVNDPIDANIELHLKRRMVSLGEGWAGGNIKGETTNSNSNSTKSTSMTTTEDNNNNSAMFELSTGTILSKLKTEIDQ